MDFPVSARSTQVSRGKRANTYQESKRNEKHDVENLAGRRVQFPNDDLGAAPDQRAPWPPYQQGTMSENGLGRQENTGQEALLPGFQPKSQGEGHLQHTVMLLG